MVDIPGMDQDIDLLQYLTLSGSLVTDKHSIEVSGDEDTGGGIEI